MKEPLLLSRKCKRGKKYLASLTIKTEIEGLDMKFYTVLFLMVVGGLGFSLISDDKSDDDLGPTVGKMVRVQESTLKGKWVWPELGYNYDSKPIYDGRTFNVKHYGPLKVDTDLIDSKKRWKLIFINSNGWEDTYQEHKALLRFAGLSSFYEDLGLPVDIIDMYIAPTESVFQGRGGKYEVSDGVYVGRGSLEENLEKNINEGKSTLLRAQYVRTRSDYMDFYTWLNRDLFGFKSILFYEVPMAFLVDPDNNIRYVKGNLHPQTDFFCNSPEPEYENIRKELRGWSGFDYLALSHPNAASQMDSYGRMINKMPKNGGERNSTHFLDSDNAELDEYHERILNGADPSWGLENKFGFNLFVIRSALHAFNVDPEDIAKKWQDLDMDVPAYNRKKAHRRFKMYSVNRPNHQSHNIMGNLCSNGGTPNSWKRIKQVNIIGGLSHELLKDW